MHLPVQLLKADLCVICMDCKARQVSAYRAYIGHCSHSCRSAIYSSNILPYILAHRKQVRAVYHSSYDRHALWTNSQVNAETCRLYTDCMRSTDIETSPFFYPSGASYAWVLAVVVSLSVCVSVTRRYCIKTAKRRITQRAPRDSPGTLVSDASSRWWTTPFPLKFVLKVTHPLSNTMISTNIRS